MHALVAFYLFWSQDTKGNFHGGCPARVASEQDTSASGDEMAATS